MSSETSEVQLLYKPQKTDYYVPEDEDESEKFAVFQSVIAKKCHLPYIPFGKYTPENEPYQYSNEWYPYVNSYYAHTEDVDAFARVSELLATKPSLCSLTSADYEKVAPNDPYSEKDAQNRYLESNPVCFIILGKPDIGEGELGRQLAEYWKCVYIEPESLVKEEIESGTRAGECIEFNLRSGRAVGIDVILKLVEKRVKSESVKHRGFVLCDLPVIPNDLYEEDPVSSESAVFTVTDIFEELIDTTIEIGVPQVQSNPQVSVSSKFKSDVDEDVEDEEKVEVKMPLVDSPVAEKEIVKIPVDVGPSDLVVCGEKTIGENYEEQLSYLFNLLEEPFLIIYQRCGAVDAINKRDGYRYDIYSQETIDSRSSTYTELISKERYLNSLPFYNLNKISFQTKHLVKLPRNFKAYVATQLDRFHYAALAAIEKRVLRHDPQFFVKVDGRAPLEQSFEIIKSRLSILPLQRAVVPEKLSLALEEHKSIQGEDAEQIAANENTDQVITIGQAYRELIRRQTPSNNYNWTWSEWVDKCPVSLRNGQMKSGDPNFAVHFMNRIFFLANEEAYLAFIRNPRPYLMRPQPRPNCKIFIFGPPRSGKTSLSRCLAYYLNGCVVSPKQILEKFKSNQVNEYLEKVRQAAIVQGLKLLNEERIAEAAELEAQRVENIKDWARKTIVLIEELITLLYEIQKEETSATFEISSFPMQMKTQNIKDIENEDTIALAKKREELEEMNVTWIDHDISTWEALLHDRKKLLNFLPNNLKHKTEPKKATVFDEFVKNYVEEAVKNAQVVDMDINNKNVFDMFVDTLKSIEETRAKQGYYGGGWIVDDMLTDVEFIQELPDFFKPDEIIFLVDTSPNSSFLLDRTKNREDTQFRDFREFFKGLGNLDAAYRSPSLISTDSFKDNLGHDIISDIFDEAMKSARGDYDFRMENFKKELNKFYRHSEKVKHYFLNSTSSIIETNITNRPIIDVMKEVIEKIDKKYRMGATVYTEEDRAEEVKIFGEKESVQDEEIGEGGTVVQNTTMDVQDLDKNRKYGDTYYYCPVALLENCILWKGREEFAAKFNSKIYLMSTAEYLAKFLENPSDYVFQNQPKIFPPPRICIIGLPGTGKTTVSRAISENFGISYVNYEELLKNTYEIYANETFQELRITNNPLKAYLTSDKPLEEDTQRLLKHYWTAGPFISDGFVFDDFPKRPSDITYMIKNKLIPDVIVQLTADDLPLKKHLLNARLETWQNEVNKLQAEWEERNKTALDEWSNRRRERYNVLIEERREKRYASKREVKEGLDDTQEADEEIEGLKTSSLVSFDSVAEQEDIDEVTRIVDQEFPPITFDGPKESPVEVSEKFESSIKDALALEAEFIKTIKDQCLAELVQFVEVPVNLENPEKSKVAAYLEVDKYKFRSQSLYERCYDASLEVAERLLSSGYFFLSKFGKTCPIQYYENKNPFQLYFPMKQKFNVFPVIHRSFVYFIVGKENLEKFKGDPLKYINVEFSFPLIPFKVAVIGPPKCGKRILATRLKEEYGLQFISRGGSARHVLSYLPHSELAENMEVVLRKGWELTDDMAISSVEACCYDTNAVTQGVVFCGFPNSINEVRHLTQRGLVPNLVIDLQASEKEMMQCMEFDTGRNDFPKYSQKFIKHRYEEFKLGARDFRNWFDKEYQVTTKMNIKSSNWSVWYKSRGFVNSVLWEVKHYYRHIKEDWPLRLANMQVTPLEFLERQSSFRTFCPVCSKNSKALVSGGDPPDRTGLVQFRQYFYWLCPDHIELFLLFPDRHIQPYNAAPSMYPKKLTLSKMPENVYESGSCAVCYREKQAVRKGVLVFAVEYNQKVYLFDSEECLNKFWLCPQQYIFEISFRAPDKYASLKYQDLPILGMLEQYLAKYVIKAISFVARRRAVVPGLSVVASAAVGIGIHLKMNDPDNREYMKYYKEAFKLYCDRSQNLVNYLDNMKMVINPYIHYEEPMPEFKIPVSPKPSSTESAYTAVSKVLYQLVDSIVDEMN